MTVENADAGCCGIFDSYGFKKEKYDIAQTVGSELFDKVRESGAQTVSEFEICRVQITHGPASSACTRSAFYASGLRPARILRFGLTNTRRGFAILLSTALHTADHILERNSPGRKLTH